MTAGDHINMEQFGFKPYSSNVEAAIGNHKDMGNAPTASKRIALKNLRPSQNTLDPQTVGYYAKERGVPDTWMEGLRKSPVQVVRHQGENVVWNGHHRIAAALRNGQKTMTVKYQEL